MNDIIVQEQQLECALLIINVFLFIYKSPCPVIGSFFFLDRLFITTFSLKSNRKLLSSITLHECSGFLLLPHTLG